jgi:hypothetical protein
MYNQYSMAENVNENTEVKKKYTIEKKKRKYQCENISSNGAMKKCKYSMAINQMNKLSVMAKANVINNGVQCRLSGVIMSGSGLSIGGSRRESWRISVISHQRK